MSCITHAQLHKVLCGINKNLTECNKYSHITVDGDGTITVFHKLPTFHRNKASYAPNVWLGKGMRIVNSIELEEHLGFWFNQDAIVNPSEMIVSFIDNFNLDVNSFSTLVSEANRKYKAELETIDSEIKELEDKLSSLKSRRKMIVKNISESDKVLKGVR